MGPSMNEKRAFPRFRSRSCSKILRSSQKRRISCSSPGKSTFEGTGLYTRRFLRQGRALHKETRPSWDEPLPTGPVLEFSRRARAEDRGLLSPELREAAGETRKVWRGERIFVFEGGDQAQLGLG